jgi:hypothetical protein
MMKQAIIVQEDQPFTLASLSPGRPQRRLALAVTLALLGGLFVTAGQLAGLIDVEDDQWKNGRDFLLLF